MLPRITDHRSRITFYGSELATACVVGVPASNVIASAGALAAANGAFDAFAMVLLAPRLDLVRDVLSQLAAPLLIVGDSGTFDHVSERDIFMLRCERRVVHVENVTPFLEDPAARAGVLERAIEWLLVHEPAVPEPA